MIQGEARCCAAQPRIKWQPDWSALSKDQKDAQPVQPSKEFIIATCCTTFDGLLCARDRKRMFGGTILTGSPSD